MKMIDGCEVGRGVLIGGGPGLRPCTFRLELECVRSSEVDVSWEDPERVVLQLRSRSFCFECEENPWTVNRRRVFVWYKMRRRSSSVVAALRSMGIVGPAKPMRARSPGPCECDRRDRWASDLSHLPFGLATFVDDRMVSSFSMVFGVLHW